MKRDKFKVSQEGNSYNYEQSHEKSCQFPNSTLQLETITKLPGDIKN